MGTNQTTYTELRARYNAGWTPPSTEFANEDFTKPNAIWARFTVIDGDEKQMDIGSDQKTFRSYGSVIIQLFAPPLSGSITVIAKADTVAAVFRNWCGTTVTCREASVKKIGNDSLGWYQVNVVIPFKVDTLH